MKKVNAGIIFVICCYYVLNLVSYKIVNNKIGCMSWFNDFTGQFY